MIKFLAKIKKRLTEHMNSTDMGHYESDLYAKYNPGVTYVTRAELDQAMQAARKQASKRASYAGAVAIGSKKESKFQKHKLDCDNCGGPLTVGRNSIASCNFCNSQYYLEGFKTDYREDWGYVDNAQPYWSDGGVSLKSATSEPTIWS